MPEKKKVEAKKKADPRTARAEAEMVEAKKAEPVPAKPEGPKYSAWQLRHMARQR